MYDLHTHTILSDGELLPCELIRRMAVLGYDTIGITDHADMSNISHIIAAIERVRNSAEEYGIKLLTGVEITHVPPTEIHRLAKLAKDEGADIVVVHGETVVEPVASGTNMQACTCEYVDVLAHPGLITREEAQEASERDIFLEITARGGHNRTNGHVALVARETGCNLVVDSDAHSPGDLMNDNARELVIRGAGVPSGRVEEILTLKTNRFYR
ncbi:MAG TPA: histidinol phosphate phosphatase domain-containing protein [Methanospirillum sp.]|uniref:histidinol phosphate phosphatase domain-containing protein n=1 Tax=Methanospirillum sp. TaxID=45200 RepID=UPI002CBDDF4C|nr:histidinol phosphate phosphatase domain-containing protein [Methanospirillum sp.]HWQ62854.1 histidinol phosphate phosphatase domain-containing protein [Methanospirillum sp.]